MKKEKIITNIAIGYFLIGVVVAILFALYYKWTALSFFSPGFFAVVFSWPLQMPGFIGDFLSYGFAGKPI
ncbi:MAG: hypothetical protein Q7R49_02060 [Candidatus Daviesbacteria bacterium]|nr:hypothetical protein [Candidatus Daviesbacteria bacterium]